MSKLRLAFPLALAITAACGLISSDIATVMFDLPQRTYSFDTAKSGWNLPPATLPEIECSDDAGCCTLAMLAVTGINCDMVICDANKCAVKVTVETPPQTVNLKMEANLGSLNKQSAIDVTVSKIGYDVTTNTMNVDLPPVELFVAPDGTTSSSDAAAKRFGTVPTTPAKQPIMNGTVTLDPVGQNAFVGFAHNFGTPFVFIARTSVIVPGGTPLPMGAVEIKIKGQLSAKPSL
jgi:hypothetical protein